MRMISKIILLSITFSLIFSPSAAQTTYSSPGSYTFDVPQTGQYELRVWGAEGGDSSGAGNGAPGGYSEGTIYLQESDSVHVYVGGKGGDAGSTEGLGGFNGGGDGGNAYNPAGNGGGGGGASDVRVGGESLNDRVIVGAGGGGGGGDRDEGVGRGTGGGGGGGYYGGGAGSAADQTPHPTGGTQTSGGTGGDAYGGKSEDGSFGQGGDATNDNVQSNQFGSQLGGDGGVGGASTGGDGGVGGNRWNGEGGGGGSNYIGGVSNSEMTAGLNRGNGGVEIELTTDPAPPNIEVPFGVNRGQASQSSPASLDFNIDVDIDDDGGSAPDNTLDSCSVTVTGQDNGGSYSSSTSITSGGSNGGTGTCEFSVDNNDNANWEPGEEVSVQVNVGDSYSGSHTVSRTESFINTPPTVESVTPSDGASEVWGGEDGVNVQVEVSDWESYHTNNDLTVELLDNSLGQFATRTVSDGQGTANVDWERNGEEGMNGFDPGSSHGWEANVEDVSGSSIRQSQSFTILNPVPSEPDSPQPANEETGIRRDHDLQITAHHPDDFNMDVRFFLDDGSGFSQVGPTKSASDGETVSVSPDLDPGTEYTWYAEASTQGGSNESNRWSFTTNYRPSIDSMSTQDKASGHAISFSSTVSDQDGGQIDSCELQVTGNGDTSVYPADIEDSAGNEKICSVDSIGFQDAEWSHVQDLDLQLTVTDNQGLSASDSINAQLPNHKPVIESFGTSEYPDREAFSIDSLIRAADVDVDEMRSCSIVIDDGDNSYTAGSMIEVNSTHVRCSQDNVGSGQYPGLTVDEEIELTLRATDIHGSTASRLIMYNVPTGIDYRYSAVIVDAGGVDFLPYQVSNNGNGEAEYRTELKNVNASFGENGEDSMTYSLVEEGVKNFQIRIRPGADVSGSKELEIVTENLETGIERSESIEVQVVDTGGGTERSVPGIGLIQLVALALVACTVFLSRNRKYK